MSSSPVYCVNHPTTETLLRCYRCGKPVCTRCVRRTPVGLICKECLNNQQAGYYTATPLDYAIAFVVGTIGSVIFGAIAVLIPFFLFVIFYAPFAAGLVAEAIRFSIQKHRGKYLWLIGCSAVLVGGIIGVGLLPFILLVLEGGRALLFSPARALGSLFNLGFIIYIVLAVATVYARLRTG